MNRFSEMQKAMIEYLLNRGINANFVGTIMSFLKKDSEIGLLYELMEVDPTEDEEEILNRVGEIKMFIRSKM